MPASGDELTVGFRHGGIPRLAAAVPQPRLHDMTTTPNPEKLRVVIVGGGVAALETVLALAHLAPELTDMTLIAPNPEFVYRPMTVREPFAYGQARRYPLAPIVHGASAKLLADELAWVDPA
jgi:thioredoxin reductase